MILKVLSVVLSFFVIVFAISFAFENFSQNTVKLKLSPTASKDSDVINYGDVPVFADNLRFNHNEISYSIGPMCDDSRRSDMVSAFDIFSSRVGVVSFYEDDNEPDIRVVCSDKSIELGEDLFTAGEGGPSRIINTSGFKVIEEGKIVLYEGDDCDYPIVALHELCHVFGFDHSSNPNNIMYNTSACNQRMGTDMDEVMRRLYTIEILPDASIEGVNASLRGRYLSFNISVLNKGLIDIENISLTIFADGKEVDSFSLGELDIGFGRKLRVENVGVGVRVEKVRFVVDSEGVVMELNENNNVVEMIV